MQRVERERKKKSREEGNLKRVLEERREGERGGGALSASPASWFSAMEDFQFQRRGPAAALPGKVAAGGRAKPAACYDDVFGGPPRPSPVPARPEDYREIFGAAAACSIPVLDLPPPPVDGYELRQCSALDYLDIFGGFGGGEFAATYHELFAFQGSNGIGAPLPSELGNTAAVTGTSNSWSVSATSLLLLIPFLVLSPFFASSVESKRMGHEKQEMPVSGNITEGLSRDQFGCSLNGVALHLNDGTSQLNRPTDMASGSSKSEAVNGTIHKNQVQTIPGFSYIVRDPEIDKPHIEVDMNIFFDSSSSKETSELQHLTKAELSTSSGGELNYSVSAMKDDQRSTQLELSGSMIASTYKDNTSCSSKNKPAISISNGYFSAKMSNYQSPHENFVEKKVEGKCQINCTNTGSQSDLKVRFVASEDVRPNEEHFSCSSKGHSASCNIKLSPDCSMDDITSDAGNTRVAEANHFKKLMPGFPPCIISQSSEDKTAGQKMSNSIPDPLKDVTVNESLHSRSSSSQSISSLDRSSPDSTFLTVSDINLRTQPSQGPPPARPPPGRPSSKFDISGRNLRRTLTNYQKHDVGTGTTYKSHSFKQTVRDGLSPFDMEVDVSSAAAASVAAIKEAMELAQAKFKSAKVSRERNKDNLQSRRKLGLNEDLRSTNRDGHQTVQDNQRIREDMVVQLACGNTDGQDNVFTAQKKTAFTPSLLTGDSKEKETNTRSAEVSLQAEHWGEPEVSSVSIKEDKVGEWKIAEQFYEFIQSEKKLSKVPENSLKGDTEKRSNTRVGIIEEEQNASELKRRENLLEPSTFVVWEGDSDRRQNPSSQEPSLEFDMPGDCCLRQKEAVNAHCQEKQPVEIQELLTTEQKTKWRTSEEGFICELSKKNLRGNKDALKYKPGYGCQGPEKVQNGADETFGCEETGKDINVTDEYFKDHGEDSIVLDKLSKLDGNKAEANVMYVSNVSGKEVHLKAGCTNHEYGSLTESWEVEPKEASLLFGQDNGKTSKLSHQAYEWAENENDLKVPLDIPDVKGKYGTTGAHEGFKGKVKENMQEVQVVDSNKILKSAQGSWKGTGNVRKIEDARKASSFGKQQYISKVLLEFSGNEDAGSPVENDAQGHETRNLKGDKRENVEMSDLDKVREMKRIELEEKMLEEAKERERRKLKEEKEREKKLEEEKERERIRLEEARERERIRLEEERERERKKLEEDRKLKMLEEEKVKKLAEEREKKMLEEERETKRLEEEMKKKRLEDEEGEKKRLEDQEREKKRLEEERERKKLEDEEREKRRLEEERKKRKLEDEEREKKRLEEDKERKKLEDEEREEKKLEEEERKRMKLEDEEREKKKLEEEKERKKLEDEKREKKRLQEENEREKSEKVDRERKKSEEAEERRLEEEKKKLEEERESREREEKEIIRKKQEEEDRERSKLEEKERERRKQEEERERRRLEEIERERRKLEEKVKERKRIEEEEREKKLEEEKVRERQKIEEEKAREKKLEEEKGKEWRKREEEKERERKRLEEEREREREKDRQAVERATREAHERAFAEARERAERAAVDRITAEARQRALAEARERAEKTSAEALEKSMAEKASREARLRSERAAVERATAEARERAVEKAIAEKTAQDARERAEKLATSSREGNVREFDPQFQNVGSSRGSYQKQPDSNASFTNEKPGGSEGESAIRCKARMERHQRTVERAAKALAEKNLRDIIAQREQAERNRLAETLDADVKRWSNGKEGNLRALLSTLQYILGPESGWHPIPLTDVVTAPAVKKAYRKATLCVHPDKLQQRGASIQQKYICEKVFDLLKEAWNKFNSEER
ncbi:hypothetical protein Taro_015131 [Colocasia esculenta]|uniref:J domain-containing protein n=1 Tax=Colocasia esculenta TaxID=4460 RepID=A0A843USA3_COLES|nr:hypothetical protein [Colocasia esculenta]